MWFHRLFSPGTPQTPEARISNITVTSIYDAGKYATAAVRVVQSRDVRVQ